MPDQNIGMLVDLIKSGGDPSKMAVSMLQSIGNNNPMIQNVIGLMNSNDMNGIETIARNLCKSKGINPDEMMKNVQSKFGYK